MKDLWGRVQSGNAHVITFNWGISHIHSEKYSLAASPSKNQETSHLKSVYGYGRSTCTPPGKPVLNNRPSDQEEEGDRTAHPGRHI